MASHQLRCQPNTLHGILVDGQLEVKCRDKLCGYQRGITILHYFDVITGEMIKTSRFRDPSARKSSEEKVTCP